MAITLYNTTTYDAQYKVLKGQQVVASLPATAPGGSVIIPTTNIYTITAAATIDGNQYTSAPMKVNSGVGFRAEVKQDTAQQTYVFEVIEIPSSQPNQLEFEKTCKADVVFTVLKDNRPLQSISLTSPFMKSSLSLGDTFYISAIIDGVTTDVVTTNDPNAIITAVDDTAGSYPGYFTLLSSS